MKKLILILMIAAGLTACQKDDTAIKPTTPTTSLVMTMGKWKVTHLTANSKDETSHFTDYEFQFNINGTLNAVKSGVTTYGYWSTRTEDGQQKLNINFSSGTLTELNNNWHVKEQNVNIMDLEDANGAYLNFQKL